MIVPGIVGLSSVLLYAYLPDLLSSVISSQLVLKDGDDSILFDMFVNTPVAVDYAYYFYQVNNPKEVLRGFKPRISSVGPFCFKQYRRKKIVGWGENGETVKYLEYKSNVFSTEGEGCKSSLDEMITVINPPIAALGATIADIVREKVPLSAVSSPIIMSAMSAFLAAHQQNMFMRRSARDILLGFRINLLDTVTALIRPLEMLGFRKEDLLPGGGVPNNTFGLMYGKNNTPEGPYEVYTGKNSHYKFVHVAKYKNTPTLSFWKSQYCNQIRGSDGTMFGAGVKRSDKLWAFAADICRSIYLSYTRDGEFKGIPTYVFGIDDTLFGNTVVEPKNECFCVHPDSVKHRCSISGIFDIGACQGGAPLIVSKPEYLSTDPDLSQNVEGFAPNKEDHDSVVEVEPLTGIAVNGVKKLQFSLRVENVPFLRGFNNMKNVTYIPFAMAIEKGGLPDDMAEMIRNFVFNPLKFIYWGLLGTAGIAAFLTGRSGVRKLMANRKARDSVKQIRNSAKNLYKKRNAVDSEISSIKSKNSMAELIPKSDHNDNYANTTNVKLQLKNNEQSNRLQQLSASRLMQPFYLNGQSMMQSYFPQIIPIIMPFPYTMNQNSAETKRNDDTNQQRTNNHAAMITSLNSLTTSIANDFNSFNPVRHTNNMIPYNFVSFNHQHSNDAFNHQNSNNTFNHQNSNDTFDHQNSNDTFDHHDSKSISRINSRNISRTNSIQYPNIYPNISRPIIRERTSVLKRILPENTSFNQMRSTPNHQANENRSDIHSSNSLNQLQENKIESAINEMSTNEIAANNEEIRTNSSVSIEENVNHLEYNTLDDQFYYYNREARSEAHSLTSEQIESTNLTNQTDLNNQTADLNADKYDAGGLQAANDRNSQLMSIVDQQQSNPGHDQKKNSLDEFNVMYDDYRKIKKLGYDYNYY